MADQNEIRKMLKQGVDAYRDGNEDKAREILLRVTDMDSSNERAWYLLANMTQDPEEKRIYLENVLYVNPNNEKAQQMLDRLGGGKPEQTQSSGLSSRRMLYIGAGLVILWIVLESVLIGTGLTRRSNATATAVSFAATSTQVSFIANSTAQANATETQFAVQETQQAATDAVLTLTATFAGTATPTFDPTQLTPPPTWTPTTEPGNVTPSATPLPEQAERLFPVPPPDIFDGQFLVGWGGVDVLNVGFLPARLYPLGAEGEYRLVGDVEVNNIDINPANGQTVTYTRYFPATFDFGLARANTNGTRAQLLQDAWFRIEFLLETQQAQYSLDGTKIVFIGTSETANANVWVLDLAAPPVPDQAPLTQLTSDGAEYSNPTISPDGSQVVAVRIEPDSLEPEPDLVLIDVATQEQTRLTQDGFGLTETQTRFEPSGDAIVYVGSEGSADAPGDIIRLPVGNVGAPAIPVILEPSDERYPVFSLDGRYMAYASDRTGVFNIFIRDLETEEDYQLTAEDRDPAFPGGWYQPDVVPERPVINPLPTPVITAPEEEGAGEEGEGGAGEEGEGGAGEIETPGS